MRGESRAVHFGVADAQKGKCMSDLRSSATAAACFRATIVDRVWKLIRSLPIATSCLLRLFFSVVCTLVAPLLGLFLHTEETVVLVALARPELANHIRPDADAHLRDCGFTKAPPVSPTSYFVLDFLSSLSRREERGE
jgi:hypothetical protein